MLLHLLSIFRAISRNFKELLFFQFSLVVVVLLGMGSWVPPTAIPEVKLLRKSFLERVPQ